jgi:DNA/RNA-binding domain of Phe-tRNA-synthetase-like protein
MKVIIEPEIYSANPGYCGAAISCKIKNSETSESLWAEIEKETLYFRDNFTTETIKDRPEIAGMRRLYRDIGKDPSRYRPSSEALCRRVLKDKSLYRINTLVDIINLVSMRTGFSIGGFSKDKVCGDIRFGVGEAGEHFEGIGRGILNIEGLPVYRDEKGGIGTPTSDEERTKITIETRELLMVIHSASGKNGVDEAVSLSEDLLTRYAFASELEVIYF